MSDITYNIFHSKYTNTKTDFIDKKISISDKLNDEDIIQQIFISQNLDQFTDNPDLLINNPESISKVGCSATQQQSGTCSDTFDQQTNKSKTSPSTEIKEGNSVIAPAGRRKKQKSKSFQNQQQLEQNKNYREEVVLKFKTYILNNPKIAINFEKAIFNKTLAYCYEKKKSSSIHSNIFKNGVYQPFFQKYFEILEPNNCKYNHDLYQQICNQQLEIQDYIQLEDEQLRPQVWQKIINKKQTEMSKIENDRNLVQSTSMWYFCNHCGNNATTITKKQTRSADEGETINVYCNKCGHAWNQY